MPQSKGRNSYPITTDIEEVNGVKRKITASKPVPLAKKSKQALQYCNPTIAGPANSATRDEVTNTSTTTIITDKLSQQKDEPLKFQELQNIKKVIRNWKPPPLQKRDEANLTKKNLAKPTEVLKKGQQENTMIKGSEVIKSTLASSDMLMQKNALQIGGHSNLVDADTLSGEGTLNAKSVAKRELQEDTGEGIAKILKEATPSQSSPHEREVDDNEMNEFIIEDSQVDMQTCTNSLFKNAIFREHGVVIDLTGSQIKVPNSQDEDLFEGEDEIYTETCNDEVFINLTETLIQGNNSQDIDLFEGEEEVYTTQYSTLKLKLHSATRSKLEENDKVPSRHTDMSKQSQHCNGVTPPDSSHLTDDLRVTPVSEDMCTPTNDVDLLDITPPTVKRIPLKGRIFCTNEIDTVRPNESKHGEERFEVCTLTDDDPCVKLLKSQKLSTFDESPKLFPDTESEEDFEEPKQKSQDDKLPPADLYGEPSQEDTDFIHQLNFYRDQVQSKIQLQISDTCLIEDELPNENGSKDIECAAEQELSSPKNIQISAANDNVHLRSPENLFVVKNDNQYFHNDPDNVLSQSQGIRSVSTTCENSKNESANICSQNKGIHYVHLPDNGTQKSQNKASTALASSQNTKGSHNFHRSANMVVHNNDGSQNTSGPIPNKENKDDGPTTNASQTCLNKPGYVLPTDNTVTPLLVSLSPQYNTSQTSLNSSNSAVTPSTPSTSQISQMKFNNSKITLSNDVNPHSMLKTSPQYNESKKFLDGSIGTTTPNKENKDFPSAHLTSQTSQNGPDTSIVALNDVKLHSMPVTPQHNASQKSVSGSNSTTATNKEGKDLPFPHSTSQTSKNGTNNINTPKTSIEGHMSPTMKAVQTPKTQPVNVVLESNDVKENRQPYLYEMDQDFDFISSSQLLAIEDELKQEMLKESAHKSGKRSKPNEGQIAPRNIQTTCEGARMPVFSIATMPPLQQPFDWTQKVRDDRQKLRGIVQEMTNLNAMITKVRREMWPRRRPDEGSGSVVIRRPDDIMAPPPQDGPSTYGAGLPPGNWGRGHSRRY